MIMILRNYITLSGKDELVNDGAPNNAIISPNGYSVTFDEYGNLSYNHYLVSIIKNVKY